MDSTVVVTFLVFREKADAVFKKKEFILILIIINVVASIIGYMSYGFFYHQQLADFNPAFWILIPDCPNASLMYVFFLIPLLFEKKEASNRFMRILDAFIFIQLTRGAVITFMYVYFETGLYPEFIVALHAGMVAQAVFIIPYLDLDSINEFSIILFLVSINEFMDFFWNPPTLVQYVEIADEFSIFFIITIIVDIILLSVYIIVGLKNREFRNEKVLME